MMFLHTYVRVRTCLLTQRTYVRLAVIVIIMDGPTASWSGLDRDMVYHPHSFWHIRNAHRVMVGSAVQLAFTTRSGTRKTASVKRVNIVLRSEISYSSLSSSK